MNPRIASLALLAATSLALAGCSSTAEPADDGALTIVASTNVYADIAATVAGADVAVTALITSGAQDPHSYEATAQDRLTVSKADLVISNGGGYDAFIDPLVSDGARVVIASDLAPDAPAAEEEHDHADDHADEAGHEGHDHVAGFNEHVWYDPEIMSTVAQHIAEELSAIDPAHASAYSERSAAFQDDMTALEASLDALKAARGGDGVFVTEPVGLRLFERAGLVNETPAAFSEAVEEGQDVPAATLLDALGILSSGHVDLVAVNAQTGGAETDRVLEEAKTLSLPVVELSEMLPEGETYVSWMTGVITEVKTALA